LIIDILKARRDELLRPLQVVCGIVERRHTLPVLANVLISTGDDGIRFRSTDLDLELVASEAIEANGASPEVLVNARKLLDVVRAMPDTELSLAVSEKHLLVRSQSSRIQLQLANLEDYPLTRFDDDNVRQVSVSAGELKSLLHSIHFAMGDNDVRYFLNGALLTTGPRLTAVAIDGHRLATASISLEGETTPGEMIVPRKAALELIRLLPDDASTVKIEISTRYAKFAFANIAFTCKLIEGRYPDYRRVVPNRFEAAFSVDRQALLACLQRAVILTYERFRAIRCIADGGRLTICASNTENEESVEAMEIDYSGKRVELSFNIRYLLDVANTLKTDRLHVQFSTTHLGALICAPERDDFQYVVMALRN
jgi:DNA polymerase III subunit beta